MRRDLQRRRRHFFNKRVSLVNYVSPETRPEEMLVDDSASATVRQLGDALTETGGQRPLLRRVLADARAARSRSSRARAAGRRGDEGDGGPRRSLFEETYNLLNAWLGSCRATARTTCAGWRCWRRTSPI